MPEPAVVSPLIIAHRGATIWAPENTVAAVKEAWEYNADGVEIDVRLTRDGVFAVIHDDNTVRTTGADHDVASTSWKTISTLVTHSPNGYYFLDEHIPRLEDIIAATPPEKRILIEMKPFDNGEKRIAKRMESVLGNLSNPPNVELLSFDITILSEIRKRLPDIPLYLLARHIQPWLREWPERFTDKQLTGIDLKHTTIDRRLADVMRNAGLRLYCWTINHAGRARVMEQYGVDAITTDRPDKFRESNTRRRWYLRGK